MLQAGAIEVIITPPIGVELAGYGPYRYRYSTGIQRHLKAQALVLDDGNTRLAIITADLMGIPYEFAHFARRQVHERTGILSEHVLIACSHSHTAPGAGVTPPEFGAADQQYIRLFARYLTGAVTAAAARLQEVKLYIANGEHLWLAWNRLGKPEVDQRITTVKIESLNGETLAILAHYACHPVILGPKTLISPDYPGALRDYLQARYPDSIILFVNGACGDIDPVTNRETWGKGTPDDVLNAGARLGEDAHKVLSQAAQIAKPEIRIRMGAARLEYAIPSPATLRKKIHHYRAEAKQLGDHQEHFEAVTGEIKMPHVWLKYYTALEKRLREGKQPAQYDLELQSITFGRELALLAIPAELFTAPGLIIRATSNYEHTLPICYANGLHAYIPPRETFEEGGYAASISPVVYNHPPLRANAAEILVAAAGRLLTAD